MNKLLEVFPLPDDDTIGISLDNFVQADLCWLVQTLSHVRLCGPICWIYLCINQA